eukprot:441276-Amphidinium_carterae.1
MGRTPSRSLVDYMDHTVAENSGRCSKSDLLGTIAPSACLLSHCLASVAHTPVIKDASKSSS